MSSTNFHFTTIWREILKAFWKEQTDNVYFYPPWAMGAYSGRCRNTWKLRLTPFLPNDLENLTHLKKIFSHVEGFGFLKIVPNCRLKPRLDFH